MFRLVASKNQVFFGMFTYYEIFKKYASALRSIFSGALNITAF